MRWAADPGFGANVTLMSALNDGLRFVLELAGIAALAVWGWSAGDQGPLRFGLAVVAPLALVVVWALLIAPKAHSPLSPTARKLVGSALLAVAAGAIWVAGYPEVATVFAVVNGVNTALMLVLPA